MLKYLFQLTTFLYTGRLSPLVLGLLVILGLLGPTKTLLSQDHLGRITIPMIDLADQKGRQILVDREPNQYLGHPTTLLLEDGRTILCVYPKGHGRGAIVYKKSEDGGKSWSDRLPTPDNWSSSLEVPTLHRVLDANGTKRIILFSGLYPARIAVSEDDGQSWSPLTPIGDWGGIVVMGDVIELKTGPGHYAAFFHDDGRYFTKRKRGRIPPVFTLYKTISTDGGLTWSQPETLWSGSEMHLCEPGAVRSPDGTEIALLLRENSRRTNSQIIFSQDEGKTWSNPQPLPAVLCGDRHTIRYTQDSRLFISFRDVSPNSIERSPMFGDWVAWIGTYDDLKNGKEGQYRVRLMHNTKGADCAYPGVVVLPDDTIVTTTYGHWEEGQEPYIMTVRLKLEELGE